MIEFEEDFQDLKLAAANRLAEINRTDLTETKALAKPPTRVKALFAGIHPAVEVNGKNDPKKTPDEWRVALAILKDPDEFKKACMGVMQKVGHDPTVDRHIKEVEERFLSTEDFSLKSMKMSSRFAGKLCQWLHHLARCSKAPIK